MENASFLKSDRILHIYFKLAQGEAATKKELARQFHVAERSIQRDLGVLRCFLEELDTKQEIVCDKASHKYYIQDMSMQTLSNSEILAACKILLESRSMRGDEMLPILDKLISCCVPKQNRKAVQELIANEKHHYIEPHHNRRILDGLWEIGQAVQKHQVLELQYERLKEPRLITRRVKPVGIMFSEYYFYLTAFLEDKSNFDNPDDLFPTIYRIDRIRFFKVLDEHFHVPYKDRFEEGEFRKRVQFMYGGKLERIQFRYTGPSLEAVLDRLPTAEVIEDENSGWIIRAEVFGNGVNMWLRSQGSYIQKIDYTVIVGRESPAFLVPAVTSGAGPRGPPHSPSPCHVQKSPWIAAFCGFPGAFSVSFSRCPSPPRRPPMGPPRRKKDAGQKPAPFAHHI